MASGSLLGLSCEEQQKTLQKEEWMSHSMLEKKGVLLCTLDPQATKMPWPGIAAKHR